MKLTNITPQWENLVLEEGFRGAISLRIDGKTCTLRFLEFELAEGVSKIGSQKVASLPISVSTVARKVEIISASTNLNILAKVWVDGRTVNVMPGLAKSETWTGIMYSGQATFTMS